VPRKFYGKDYFHWQSRVGAFGGWANLWKFENFISSESRVIDFGCGGGYLLRNINCKEKIGIEVNEEARRTATELGVVVYSSIEAVPDNWADVVISNHALEHCLHPLAELENIRGKLKIGGRVVFTVPCETVGRRYIANDRNHHLYSWSPGCLGNLFTEAGYIVDECKPLIHKWPKGYRIIARIGGKRVFHICCKVYGHLERSWFQVRISAHKPQ
jgi:SAM-dependent methyltransferase